MVKTVKRSEIICEIIRQHFSDPNETRPIYWYYPYTPPEDEIRYRIKLNLWKEQKRREAKRRISSPPTTLRSHQDFQQIWKQKRKKKSRCKHLTTLHADLNALFCHECGNLTIVGKFLQLDNKRRVQVEWWEKKDKEDLK